MPPPTIAERISQGDTVVFLTAVALLFFNIRHWWVGDRLRFLEYLTLWFWPAFVGAWMVRWLVRGFGRQGSVAALPASVVADVNTSWPLTVMTFVAVAGIAYFVIRRALERRDPSERGRALFVYGGFTAVVAPIATFLLAIPLGPK
jgi:hypothetical protein